MHGQGHRRELQVAEYGDTNYQVVPTTSSAKATRTRAESPTRHGTVRFTRDGKRINIPPPARHRHSEGNAEPSSSSTPRTSGFRQGRSNQPRPVTNGPSHRSNSASPSRSRVRALSQNRAISHSTAISSTTRRSNFGFKRRPTPKRPHEGPTVEEFTKNQTEKFLAAVQDGSLGDSVLDASTSFNGGNTEIFRIKVKAQDFATQSSTLPDNDYYARHPELAVVFYAVRKALVKVMLTVALRSVKDRPETMAVLDYKKHVATAEKALEDAKDCTPSVRAAYVNDGKEDFLDKAIEIIGTKKVTPTDQATADKVTSTEKGTSTEKVTPTDQVTSTSTDRVTSTDKVTSTDNGNATSTSTDSATSTGKLTPPDTADGDGTSAGQEAPVDSNSTDNVSVGIGIIKLGLSNNGVDYYGGKSFFLPLPDGLEGELIIRVNKPLDQLPQYLSNVDTYVRALNDVAISLFTNPDVNTSANPTVAPATDDSVTPEAPKSEQDAGGDNASSSDESL